MQNVLNNEFFILKQNKKKEEEKEDIDGFDYILSDILNY